MERRPKSVARRGCASRKAGRARIRQQPFGATERYYPTRCGPRHVGWRKHHADIGGVTVQRRRVVSRNAAYVWRSTLENRSAAYPTRG